MSPPKPELGSEGASPPKPTRTVEGLLRSRPYNRIRKTRSSSDGVRLLEPLRSSSVAGKGGRERKSAFPLTLPLRYSMVLLYLVTNSINRCTRGLCSAILSRLSSILRSEEKPGKWYPTETTNALDASDDAARFRIEGSSDV